MRLRLVLLGDGHGRLRARRRSRLRIATLTPSRPSPRRIAVYLSAHGLGHAVRTSAVLAELARLLPIRISVFAPCDRRVWPAALAGLTERWEAVSIDPGVVQSDDVTVDLHATSAAVERWGEDLADILDTETRRLAKGRFDLVVGDVPPPAFEAAKRAAIPSVAIANFTWDWIYSALGLTGAARTASDLYASATLALEALPAAPMAAFRRRTCVGLVARRPALGREAARQQLGVDPDRTVALLAFQAASAPSVLLPPARPQRVFVVPEGWPAAGLRDDLRIVGREAFADAVAAADVVVGKPGYGLIGDVEANGARLLYVPRPGFPENAVLERYLEGRAASRPLSSAALARGDWEEDLLALEDSPRPEPADARGAEAAAREIATLLGVDSIAGTD